jgi:hypothetical protein
MCIVEGREKARGFERKHSIYFQDGHRKCRNGIPEFKKGTAFLPSTFSGKVTNSANTEKHRETQDSRNPLQGRNDGRLMPGARRRRGEAAISLLSDFMLEFLRHTRSSMTKIVTYLRNSTTQYDMKIRMKGS